ncbi:hypothetical protein CARUB_v10025040mg [Capsella rubella]|uniref:RNase H type-1 domain-containing protein n=1 Tax=Capsella rubella TaxID=81985 RepID=R0G072_9BRAS|nr:hypothetical protein CARUB_v10025040mg [Capsella rubella]
MPEADHVPPPNGSVELKREIWNLNNAPKIKYFLRRVVSCAMETATQLQKRHIPVNVIAMDNIRMLIHYQKQAHDHAINHSLPFWIIWRIWKSRNDFIFRKINRQPHLEAQKGIQDARDWLEVTKVNHLSPVSNLQPGPTSRDNNWRPPEGLLKCNFDSGFVQDREFTSSGWIIRDCNGNMIVVGSANLPRSTTALQAEAIGFLHALQVIWSTGFRYVWFEGDCLELTSLIHTHGDHLLMSPLLYDIRYWMSKLPRFSLGHVHRGNNEAADKLSSYANSMLSLYESFTVPPSWLLQSL